MTATRRVEDYVNLERCVDALEDERAKLRKEAERYRGLLLWALYHSQGGSSPVGQPIRRVLGIGTHGRLTEEEVTIAKLAAEAAMALKSAEDRKIDSWCPSA